MSEINTIVVTGSLSDGRAVKMINNLRPVYSKEIEWKAMPIMKFLQFAKLKTELGTEPGLSIQMMTYNNIKRGGKLVEGTRMTTTALSSSMKSISVSERGNALSATELALRASFTDVMSDMTTALGRDMAIVLDTELRDVALTGGEATATIFGRADSTTAKISARTAITSANTLSVATIKDGVELLATSNSPKIAGNYYVCFVHPHQSRSLRDDLAWIEASKYGAPEQLFTGEIGRIEDVRFIETTLMSNGACGEDDDAYDADLIAGATGSSTTVPVYKAILFGEDYYAMATSLPVELRDGGVVDFGREHSLAWYAIWGTGILNSERGVVIETC